MRVAGVLTCSFVNGDGARYVIFTQGCAHHCQGCQNPETWDFDGGTETPVSDLAADIAKHLHIDGITLSGGDPFYQQAECVELIRLLPKGLTVWAYTGFRYDEIKDTTLADLCDVIVDGPFIPSLKCEGEMYGSSNQHIYRKERRP